MPTAWSNNRCHRGLGRRYRVGHHDGYVQAIATHLDRAHDLRSSFLDGDVLATRHDQGSLDHRGLLPRDVFCHT